MPNRQSGEDRDEPGESEKSGIARSLRAMQQNIQDAGPAMLAGYTLIGAIALGGVIGYLLDRWMNTTPWFLVGGLMFGIIVGFVELARVVWRS